HVQAGTYVETILLGDGVAVVGGFDAAWSRGSYDDAEHRVVVHGVDGATVRARDVTATLDGVVLDGPDATAPGDASYVAVIDRAQLSLANVTLRAGRGAAGAPGAAGVDAASLAPAPVGNDGGSGLEYSTPCDAYSFAHGGVAASNGCSISASSRDMRGGDGGDGGRMDTYCLNPANYNATGGLAGASAPITAGGFGVLGASGPPNDPLCDGGHGARGGDGTSGMVMNGLGGHGGMTDVIAGGQWRGIDGQAGAIGENGGGG